MALFRFGSQDLLEYNATYGVIICRKCQYAIQKSALQSHLLRHKIYRDERQRLLASIAELNQFEPEHVPLPTPDSLPIDNLPIISGYRCTAAGCRNLCVSSKRMRRHQSEVHGNRGPSGVKECARTVKLQTFFRGTKIQYFEVTLREGHDKQESIYGVEKATITQSLPSLLQPPQKSAPSTSTPKCFSIDLDLRMLTYFHHFTTITTSTLPGKAYYWQMDIVPQALQSLWLMYGLLALAACHMASLADDIEREQDHRQRSMHFFRRFEVGWEEAKDCVDGVTSKFEDVVDIAGKNIKSVLLCAYWPLAPSPRDASLRLQFIMKNIRNSLVPELGERETKAQTDVRVRSPSNAAFSHRLHALPIRMAETFGKPTPECIQDVLGALSAINSLVDCIETSFTSNDARATYWALAIWLAKLSDHFNDMVEKENPAALVVVAYSAASLVKRAEDCGCWFLEHVTQSMIRMIGERLPFDDRQILSLVEGLIE
jgi:hypothetical protein